jgi:hypothetical protein
MTDGTELLGRFDSKPEPEIISREIHDNGETKRLKKYLSLNDFPHFDFRS